VPGRSGRVDSRDVLDTNARTARGFRGRVVASYERTGPDRWDPFRRVPVEGPALDVMPGVEIQVEETGARFRMRAEGAVQVVEWQPDEGEAEGDVAERRSRFLESCVTPFSHDPGMGAAAFIARTLSEGRKPEPE